MKNDFVGRKKELRDLKALLHKKSPSLVVIKGRRRIGKSRLVTEFGAHAQNFFSFTGVPPVDGVTRQDQLREFARQISVQFDLPVIEAKSWGDLFLALSKQIKENSTVILFDEISWMAHKDPMFLGELKVAWDIVFNKNPKLVLVLCGSVSSWIERNILSSTGFLGRVSLAITLQELALNESSELLDKIGFKGSATEKLMILSITGGVPRYIELIDSKKSAERNIKDLCFTRGGILTTEFTQIFHDLFASSSTLYEKILIALVDGPMEYSEISKTINYTSSGPLSQHLENLIMCGFIARDFSWSLSSGSDSKLSKYRLSDNYSRFYLKYIGPALNRINKDQFADLSLSAMPNIEGVLGLQFENMVLNNRRLVWEALGLKGEEITADNPFFQRKTKLYQGCQIDYLVQTKHNSLFACEVKFTRKEIGMWVVQDMQDKLARLVLPKRFSCFPVLIHVNGVTSELEDSAYFARIINVGSLYPSLFKFLGRQPSGFSLSHVL